MSLHKGNSVTISESCIPHQLPPGRYPYEMFQNLDVYTQPTNPSNKDIQIEDLQREFNVMEYNLRNAEFQLQEAHDVLERIRELALAETRTAFTQAILDATPQAPSEQG